MKFVTNSEYCFLIKKPESEGKQIIEIRFNITIAKEYKTIFKVHLYSVRNEVPNEELLKKQLVFLDETAASNKMGQVVLDISEMNIIFPKEGVFIDLELMGFLEKSTGLIRKIDYFKSNGKALVKPSSLFIHKNNVETGKIFGANFKSDWVVINGLFLNGIPMFGITIE